MEEDLVQIMQEQVSASKRKGVLSFDESRKTTMYSQDLLDQYCSTDSGVSGVAAFRIDAYLAEHANHPFTQVELTSIAAAHRSRIAQHPLGRSDLRIGLALHSHGAFDRQNVASLVTSMKGSDDYSVASEAQRLLPIIGKDFAQDYLRSTERSETGGIGGPQRPLIQTMTEAALRCFNSRK